MGHLVGNRRQERADVRGFSADPRAQSVLAPDVAPA